MVRFEALLLDSSVAGPDDLHRCHLPHTDCAGAPRGEGHGERVGHFLRLGAGLDAVLVPGHDGRTRLGEHGDTHLDGGLCCGWHPARPLHGHSKISIHWSNWVQLSSIKAYWSSQSSLSCILRSPPACRVSEAFAIIGVMCLGRVYTTELASRNVVTGTFAENSENSIFY